MFSLTLKIKFVNGLNPIFLFTSGIRERYTLRVKLKGKMKATRVYILCICQAIASLSYLPQTNCLVLQVELNLSIK